MTGKYVLVHATVWCFVLVVLFLGARSQGFVYGGMFGGRVVDKESNEPVSGAYVIAIWRDYTLNRTGCVHMDIGITDEHGKYFFGPWVDFVGRLVVKQHPASLMVYSPGYEKTNYGEPIYVRRHDDTPKERIKEIVRLTSLLCGREPKETEKIKVHMRKTMYMEAKKQLAKITADSDGEYSYDVRVLKRTCGKDCQ